MADEENEDQFPNLLLFDALVRNQIYILRYSETVRKKVRTLLDKSEADLVKEIERRLAGVRPGLETPAQVIRMQKLLKGLKSIRTTTWHEVNTAWVKEVLDVAGITAESLNAATLAATPTLIETIMPSAGLLKSIATSRPFEGRTLREWSRTIMQEDLRRIENAVRVGMVTGEDSATIARRIVGTVGLKGTDGLTEITRRQANAITRTAVNFIAAEARAEFTNANAHLFDRELYVATLDSRTTPVCRGHDGHIFPRGKGPRPPLHFQCRSLRVPTFDVDVIGDRPARPHTERILLREYARREGIPTPASRAALPRGTKGAYDAFARARIREMTQRIPGKTSYQKWLKTQSHEFQDDVLGKTKAKLFRDGGLTLDKFVNRQGDELTLAQLARREARAFHAAGLNPDAFR